MKIKLANGIELYPILAEGGSRFIQGANRDAITFIFPVETSLDELDRIFTAENCSNITITEIVVENDVEVQREYIHSGYAVRVELKREPVEITPATVTTEAVFENRVMVTMAQRTYAEAQLAALTETVDFLVLDNLLN